MKKPTTNKQCLALLMGCLFFLSTGFARISLPAIFADNMVLQQKTEVEVWGWGQPREKITIDFGWTDENQNIEVTNQGTWRTTVQTPTAGGPYTIEFKGSNKITLNNVLIGEVWICSGQSNMQWSANAGIDNAALEIQMANYPNIRFFSVHHRSATAPQIDLEGNWEECNSMTMQNFSAIAYFFARKVQHDMNVPIGLINSSWGGTPAEAWMPAEAITSNTRLAKAAEVLKPVPWGPVEVARIYNAMIAPLHAFKLAGALWYQGESNTINGEAYREMFGTLIESWRAKWGYDFPFYFAQIAPYKYGRPNEGAVIRDAQRRTLELPQTAMVVTSDIGDTTDIHPKNKQDVGLRLANLALANHYKSLATETSGPLFKRMVIKKNKVEVYFDHAEGLHYRGDQLTHFEIAGKDQVFHSAQASIEGDKVVVKSGAVARPTAVRFAWGNLATPNLFNAAGLPASCFTTTSKLD